MSPPIKICAVLTAFNRREQTVDALRSYFSQGQGLNLTAVLMDDGSTDGTTAAVQAEFRQVTVLSGNGSLYWNRGMAAAYQSARSLGADYYLWLNDDTLLERDSLNRLVQEAGTVQEPRGSILVGSTRDPNTGELTYGGLCSASSWHPGKFSLLQPRSALQQCHAMNGNIVLISAAAADSVGEMDEFFTHAMGDYDYALRACKVGVSVAVASGWHGVCARNPVGTSWFDQPSISARWRAVNSPKGLPMQDWAYFLQRHGGLTWPLAWLVTYRRILTIL